MSGVNAARFSVQSSFKILKETKDKQILTNREIVRISIDNLDTQEKEKARSVESNGKKINPYEDGLVTMQTERIVTSEDGDRN